MGSLHITSISPICSLTCGYQSLRCCQIQKSSSHRGLVLQNSTGWAQNSALQSLCFLYWQIFSIQKPSCAYNKVCRSVLLYFNCFFLPGQLLGATISLDKMAVLCLFLMPYLLCSRRGTGQNLQGRLWPHQPYSSKVPCAAHVPFSASTSCRKVCLTGVIITTWRNLAAVLGKTSVLFYPQDKTAFTGDWHFAEVSLVPRAWW